MKHFICWMLFVILMVSVAECYAWGNVMEEPYDKLSHAAAGTAITSVSYKWLVKRGWDKTSAKVAAHSINVATWVAKEVSDKNFDWQDAGAGFVGLGKIEFTF